MANYRKYYIVIRLLLLKQYLGANAGRSRRRKQSELEQLLEERNMTEKPCAVPNRAAQGSLFEIFR